MSIYGSCRKTRKREAYMPTSKEKLKDKYNLGKEELQ